jgi:hypothetical protein
MNYLQIERTHNTPDVNLNLEQGVFSISGRSITENTFEFYEPIFAKLKDWAKNYNNKLTATFNLEYFNSAAAKTFIDIFKTLKGLNAEVIWLYDKNDDDILEVGENYKFLFENGLKFKIQLKP